MSRISKDSEYGNLFKPKKKTFFDILKIGFKKIQKRSNTYCIKELGMQSPLKPIH